MLFTFRILFFCIDNFLFNVKIFKVIGDKMELLDNEYNYNKEINKKDIEKLAICYSKVFYELNTLLLLLKKSRFISNSKWVSENSQFKDTLIGTICFSENYDDQNYVQNLLNDKKFEFLSQIEFITAIFNRSHANININYITRLREGISSLVTGLNMIANDYQNSLILTQNELESIDNTPECKNELSQEFEIYSTIHKEIMQVINLLNNKIQSINILYQNIIKLKYKKIQDKIDNNIIHLNELEKQIFRLNSKIKEKQRRLRYANKKISEDIGEEIFYNSNELRLMQEIEKMKKDLELLIEESERLKIENTKLYNQ